MKKYTFKIHGSSYAVDIKNVDGNLVELEVNGTPYEVELEKTIQSSKTPKLVRSSESSTPATPKVKPSGEKLSRILAPLPGNITEVKATPGMTVEKNDLLMVMEAMKMENSILAEKSGTVKTVKVKPGDAVMQGDVLVEIE